MSELVEVDTTRVNATYADMRAQLADMTDKYITVRADRDIVLADFANMHDKLAGARAQLACARAQLADTRATLSDTRAQLANTRAQLADTRAQLADTRAQLADTLAQLVDMTNKYDTERAAVAANLANPAHFD
jgi:chromosome segregation ATPase